VHPARRPKGFAGCCAKFRETGGNKMVNPGLFDNFNIRFRLTARRAGWLTGFRQIIHLFLLIAAFASCE
jgi:hypothetical protein